MTAKVIGVGTSLFGKQPDKTSAELAWTAILEALNDAGDEPDVRRLIDAVFVGNVFGEPGVAVRALQGVGLLGLPVVTIESACASGTAAFHEAVAAIELGRYRTVLVLGLEHMTSIIRGPIVPQQSDAEGRSGLAMPAIYALAASRWLEEGRVTREQLAAVSVKNHAHAMGNPRAQYRGHYTIEQVLASTMIADPITLLQSSPVSDGAAALVLSADERPDRPSVRVRASVQSSGRAWDQASDAVWGYELVKRTASAAYAAAGIGPGDVNVIEVHDAFTIGELATTEALGMVPEGLAGAYAAAGRTALGGDHVVINPSGGLLSRGHPLGATGVAQVAEIVWQLRGEAGARQVDGPARLGLVETMGGGVAGVDGNACVVTVLEAPATGRLT